MPQAGAQPMSFRIPGMPWGGMSLDSKAAPGQFQLIENGYVSSDGDEIRTMPGYVCVIDPETQARETDGTDTTTGYRATHYDAERSVISLSGSYYFDATPTERLKVYTEPVQIHFMEQVGGRWELIGESDFVREPILTSGGVECTIATATSDGSGEITIALSQTPGVTANTFNYIYATPTGTVIKARVWISEITGDLANVLNDKGHVVTDVAGNVLTLATVGPLSTASINQTGKIAKVKPTSAANTPISDDKMSLTSWTSLTLGDPDSVASDTVYCAHVANRQRDFGDATGELDEGHGQLATYVDYPRSRRRQKTLPYRLVPHVAGNRIIMAAPGYGCVFQKPSVLPINYDDSTRALGLDSYSNDIYDKPRALGIPKAIVWVDPQNENIDTNAASGTVSSYHHYNASSVDEKSFGGSDASVTDRNGTYRFAFAYRDEATGERGLLSEEVVLTSETAVAFRGFLFHVLFPGYLLAESLALRLDVFRSVKNGTQLFFSESVPLFSSYSGGATAASVAGPSAKYGLVPDTTAASAIYWRHIAVKATYTPDEELRKNPGYAPVIEQMPMGCKASRTLRGWTLFGGALGDAGSLQQLQTGSMTLQFNRNATSPSYDASWWPYDQVASANFGAGSGGSLSYAGSETPFGVANSYLPTSYEGQSIMSDSLFPWPSKQVQLGIAVNTVSGFTGTSWPTPTPAYHTSLCFKVQNSPIVEAYDISRQGKETFLILPRGKIQISEKDNPGVTPSTSITPVSSELDQDIEAIGDVGGNALLATRDRAYMLGFSNSPVGITPDLVSDRFGCIAANTMVSFDGGCAWISDRGPVAFRGGVEWIGSPLQRLFSGAQARYKKDSTGMMRHSWGCHDPERNLIYFGMFADRFAGTDNEATINYPARSIASVAISTGGSGYVDGDVLTIVGGSTGTYGEAATVRVMVTAGAVTSAYIEKPGKYLLQPSGTVTVTGGSGNDATFTVGWDYGTIMQANWDDTALSPIADQLRSRFACDEILIYSYRTGAWSVWRPPGTLAIQWMTNGKDDNGVNRVFFLGSDRRVYVLDDSYGMFQKDPAEVTPTETGSQTTLTVPASDANRVGVPVLVCHEPNSGEKRIKAFRTIASVGVGTITLNSAVTINPGDWLVIGARSMTITTTAMSPKMSEASRVNAVGGKMDMWSLKSAIESGEDQGVYYRVKTSTVHVEAGVLSSKTPTLTKADESSEDYSWTTPSPSGDPIVDWKAAKGTALGHSHQVTVDFVGGAQVRLHDLYAEVQ